MFSYSYLIIVHLWRKAILQILVMWSWIVKNSQFTFTSNPNLERTVVATWNERRLSLLLFNHPICYLLPAVNRTKFKNCKSLFKLNTLSFGPTSDFLEISKKKCLAWIFSISNSSSFASTEIKHCAWNKTLCIEMKKYCLHLRAITEFLILFWEFAY